MATINDFLKEDAPIGLNLVNQFPSTFACLFKQAFEQMGGNNSNLDQHKESATLKFIQIFLMGILTHDYFGGQVERKINGVCDPEFETEATAVFLENIAKLYEKLSLLIEKDSFEINCSCDTCKILISLMKSNEFNKLLDEFRRKHGYTQTG
jgi:hypothetical protein